MRLPPGAVSPATTKVLLALLRCYARQGRVTVRDVMVEADYRTTNSVHAHLVQLRNLGLVTWADNRSGTLRPTVALVLGPSPDRHVA